MMSGRWISLILVLMSCQLAGDAKTWTVDERQTQLMQQINYGQRTGQLTMAEAHDLRKQVASILRKKIKMKAKAPEGQLTPEDTKDLEKDLNNLSLDLDRYKQAKRVTK